MYCTRSTAAAIDGSYVCVCVCVRAYVCVCVCACVCVLVICDVLVYIPDRLFCSAVKIYLLGER